MLLSIGFASGEHCSHVYVFVKKKEKKKPTLHVLSVNWDACVLLRIDSIFFLYRQSMVVLKIVLCGAFDYFHKIIFSISMKIIALELVEKKIYEKSLEIRKKEERIFMQTTIFKIYFKIKTCIMKCTVQM